MKFTHIDQNNHPLMVDISDKEITKRIAIAQSIIEIPDSISREIKIKKIKDDVITPKGSVFQTAIIAGIMGSKKTSELIPLCHQISLDKCNIDITFNDEENQILITCKAQTSHKTGVEMEALVGANIAALTIYDMCKAFSHKIIIKETKLLSKTGGKSDFNTK